MSRTSKKLTIAEKASSPNVIPFPLVRCRDLILQMARDMLPRGQKRRVLAARLERQRETMEERGIVPEKIDAELAAFERAVLCEYQRQTREMT